MFQKLVAIEDTLLSAEALKKLSDYAVQVELYNERPVDDAEIIRRIGDADAVLVSFKSPIRKCVLDACPNIRYIGMCCTLYDEKACNVDVVEARRKGITVVGVKDYGDVDGEPPRCRQTMCERVAMMAAFTESFSSELVTRTVM